MALRVAILAAIALVVFAVLFLRLWSLQILSGDEVRERRAEQPAPHRAPRGAARDDRRPGRPRRSSRTSAATAVEVWPADLPKQGRYAEMKQLATVLHVPLPKVLARLEQRKNDPLTPVTVQVSVHKPQLDYLAEHRREFPGVHTRLTYLRKYNSRGPARPRARLRRRDLAPMQLKQLRKDGYERRRPGRPDRRRAHVRQLPARQAGDRRGARRTRSAGPSPARSRSSQGAPAG